MVTQGVKVIFNDMRFECDYYLAYDSQDSSPGDCDYDDQYKTITLWQIDKENGYFGRYLNLMCYHDLIVVDNGEEFWNRFYPECTKVILEDSPDIEYAGCIAEVQDIFPANGKVTYAVNVLTENFNYVERITVYASQIMGRLYDNLDYIPPKPKKYIKCEKCHTRFEYDFDDNIPYEDRYLCPQCRKRLFITPYHMWNPPLDFKGESKDGLYFGVELEVDGGGEDNINAAHIMQMINTDGRYCWCSHDSSLYSGFEIITMPCTLEYHKSKEKELRKAFKELVNMGYRGHNTNTAGIHIHFSRDFYGDEYDENEANIANLLYLVDKFWKEIIIFSRRDYNKSQTYMKKIDKYPNDFVRDWDRSEEHEGHYYAVNITNSDTIELRFFKSTLNFETFMATLEFADKLVRTAKDKSNSELQALKFEELLTPKAKRYYNSRLQLQKFNEIGE